ncbi:PadR family transcriptional regulator [Kineococcus glutinatus]|uniref:PadR family transcriptional regulator n=1 Tax=Kineococcus glutinatus TaxID=1070872 RepID=A0ABP9HNQ9_9ACTN
MAEEPWPAEWQRGLLPTAVLGAIGGEPMYGYRISQRLERLGWGTITGGALYPVLRSLEDAGLLTSRWEADGPGPARRYYDLTERGRQAVDRRRASWSRFSTSMTTLFGEEARR